MNSWRNSANSAIGDDGWLEGVQRIQSPNQDERPPGELVSLIVVHAISLPPGQFGGDGIVQLFTNRLDPAAHPYFVKISGLQVSAHFLVRRDGQLIQFVSCQQRAWHAGLSSWQGRVRCNDFSLGIELEGCDELPFEEVQYGCLVDLLQRCFSRAKDRPRARLRLAAPQGDGEVAPGFALSAAACRSSANEATAGKASAQKAADSVDCLGKPYNIGRISEPQMFFRRIAAEIQARCDRDSCRIQEVASEAITVDGQFAAIDVEVEGAVRSCSDAKTQSLQSRCQEVPPFLELVAPCFKDVDGRRREGGERGVLRRCRW